MAGFTIARLVVASVLFVALGRLPYTYYTLTRFLCGLVAAYGVYLAVERQQQRWAWAFGATAFLFNPFLPVRLDRSTWAIVDVAAAILMLSSVTNRSLSRTPLESSVPLNAVRPGVGKIAPRVESTKVAGSDSDKQARLAHEQQRRQDENERFRRWQKRAYKR